MLEIRGEHSFSHYWVDEDLLDEFGFIGRVCCYKSRETLISQNTGLVLVHTLV